MAQHECILVAMIAVRIGTGLYFTHSVSFLEAVSPATQAEGVIFIMSLSLFISRSEIQH